MRSNHRDDYAAFELTRDELDVLTTAVAITKAKTNERYPDYHPVARDATAKAHHALQTLLRHAVVPAEPVEVEVDADE